MLYYHSSDEKQKPQEKGGLGLGVQGSAEIPGLDLTEATPKGVEENDKSKEKKSSTTKTVFHDQEDEKIGKSCNLILIEWQYKVVMQSKRREVAPSLSMNP